MKRFQSNSCRFPLFNCRLINKLRSNKKQKTNKGNTDINSEFGGYGQSSSSHPLYVSPSNNYQSSQNEGTFPLLTTYTAPYSPQSTYTAQSYGQSANTIDVHQVLDQFLRSAGLSPQGDHEAEAAHSSSFAKAGTKPVLVFKRLFSFPFYLSTDPNVVDIYGKNWK